MEYSKKMLLQELVKVRLHIYPKELLIGIIMNMERHCTYETTKVKWQKESQTKSVKLDIFSNFNWAMEK